MKFHTEGHLPLSMVSAIVTQASGLQFFSYRPSIAYDARSNWFGDDIDVYQDEILGDFLDDIEDDLVSVWSSNISEKESEEYSAERSALADANGEETDAESGNTGSELSVSANGSVSSDSSEDSIQTPDNAHQHESFKYFSYESSSSVSFKLVKPFDFFGNFDTDDGSLSVGTSIEILDADGNRPQDSLLIG